MRKRRIGTAKFFTLLLLLYHTSANAEGDYALYPFYVLRGQGTAADGGVQDFEVLVYALAG